MRWKQRRGQVIEEQAHAPRLVRLRVVNEVDAQRWDDPRLQHSYQFPALDRRLGDDLRQQRQAQATRGRAEQYFAVAPLWTYAAGRFDRSMAIEAAATGHADMVAFGHPIGNPDLVAKLSENAALREPDHATLYGGGEKG